MIMSFRFTYYSTLVCILYQRSDFDDDVAAAAAVDDDDGDDGGGVDDDVGMQNHFLYREYHRRMMLVEARMDRMVLLKPRTAVDHCNVVYNTYHYNRHPIENYPFDSNVVETNLET